MKKLLFIFSLVCVVALTVSAQTGYDCDSCWQNVDIRLKNGNVFSGNIVLRNSALVMLQTDGGTRFQFPLAEIENISQQSDVKNDSTPAEKTTSTRYADHLPAFRLCAEVGGDTYFNNSAFAAAFAASGAVILGVETSEGFYFGVGTGYENVFLRAENLNLLRFFLHTHKRFSRKTLAPYAALSLGYALISNDDFTGGFSAEGNAGLSLAIGGGRYLLFGAAIGIQSCHTTLLENISGNSYQYQGELRMPKIGLRAGIVF